MGCSLFFTGTTLSCLLPDLHTGSGFLTGAHSPVRFQCGIEHLDIPTRYLMFSTWTNFFLLWNLIVDI